ncbi:MAG: hypothetical protein MZV70_34190 [Desulfobacterales bacterium]|nr:hypothetical protein [Desulfobacterales bacterium]
MLPSFTKSCKISKLAVLTGYSGMDVAKMTALRMALRKIGTRAPGREELAAGHRVPARRTSARLEEHFKGPWPLAIDPRRRGRDHQGARRFRQEECQVWRSRPP